MIKFAINSKNFRYMDTEATRIDGTLRNDVSPQTGTTEQGKDASKMHTRIAGITGLGLGAVGTVVIGKIIDTTHKINEIAPEQEEVTVEENVSSEDRPAWAIGDIQIAEGINDDMSFGEAFAAARAEVGPGGAFEWHGTVYGTYTADEWNNMSVADRTAYNDHFSWNHVNATSGNVATVQPIETSNDIEVVSVNPAENHHYVNHSDPDVVMVDDQPEIEVLGVVHDHETGANIGGITVDGQEVYLVDVDGDMEFDIVASDLNNNGQLDEGEAFDIHGNGLTVDHLGGFSNPNDAIQASDDYLGSTDDFAMPV